MGRVIQKRLFQSWVLFVIPSEKSYFSDTEVLHMVYFANFQSVTDYDTIFWGNSTSSSQFLFWGGAQKEDNQNYDRSFA